MRSPDRTSVTLPLIAMLSSCLHQPSAYIPPEIDYVQNMDTNCDSAASDATFFAAEKIQKVLDDRKICYKKAPDWDGFFIAIPDKTISDGYSVKIVCEGFSKKTNACESISYYNFEDVQDSIYGETGEYFFIDASGESSYRDPKGNLFSIQCINNTGYGRCDYTCQKPSGEEVGDGDSTGWQLAEYFKIPKGAILWAKANGASCSDL